MKLILPKPIFSKLMRAVVEFDMIQEGDKILIGLSGGKDSQMLTYALATLRLRIQKKFTLAAVTINPMFTDNFSAQAADLQKFCAELQIPHEIHAVDIKSAIDNSNKNPCFTCAYFRRAAINRIAREIGANKVAYAHHLDDAVETFFMSLLSSGQLATFTPTTYLSRSNITVIRPLVYLREFQIVSFAEKNFNIVKSPCPIDGKTNRQNIKNLIASLEKTFPDLFAHLAAAMRENSIVELWSAPKSLAEMRQTYFSYVKR